MPVESTRPDAGFVVLLGRRRKKGLRMAAFPTREEAERFAAEAQDRYKVVAVVPAGPLFVRQKPAGPG